MGRAAVNGWSGGVMTPQAHGKARTIPIDTQAQIIELRKAGKTIADSCLMLELEGNAAMASVQNLCLQHFGKRDFRGPEIGYQPGKTKSFRRGMAQ